MANSAQKTSLLEVWGLSPGNNEMDLDGDSDDGSEKQHLETFPQGMSDEDKSEDLFGDTLSLRAYKSGKKSPRRLRDPGQDNDAPEPSPTKKPRISLFGGPLREQDDADESLPQTPGTSLGGRFSSLNLEQQEGDSDSNDNAHGEGRSSRPNVDLDETVFVSDDDDSHRHSPDLQTYADDPVEAYSLRKNINRQVAATTHIDIDQSGNYDPVEEAAHQRTLRMRLTKRAKQGKQRQETKKRKGKGKAKAVPVGPDVEPEDDLTGHPVARGCKECRDTNQHCSIETDGIYPCHKCLDNAIDCHQIFRPCSRCEERGQFCSFEDTDEPEEVMCDECLEVDNIECKMRPAKYYRTKRIDLDQQVNSAGRKFVSCTHCRENNKKCSLKRITDEPPCNRCKKHKFDCRFDAITRREKMKPKNKKKERAKEEQPEAEEASKSKSKRTRMEDIAPEFSIPGSDLFGPEDLAYLAAESSADDDESAHEESEESAEPEILEDAEGHKGFLAKIKTSFAHPMVFSVGPDDTIDCDFCKAPSFGMVGHFEREIHVIQWTNGLGYTELGNGHRENETGGTTMCQQCTFHRLQIMTCPEHTLEPIELEGPLDFDAAAEDLMSVQGGSLETQQELLRWCSTCFSLATHQCCTTQPYIDPEDEEMIHGCGLHFCNRCARDFEQKYQKNLYKMVTVLEKEPKPMHVEDESEDEEEANGEEGSDQGTVRADVGLLNAKGLLMRCVNGGMTE